MAGSHNEGMSAQLLASLPNYTDTCGCSLLEGRCQMHAAMMRDIHDVWTNGNGVALEVIWSLQDGYGTQGYEPEQGLDWSGIRDSSTSAIQAMWTAIHA
jgi:hypothetical protein